MWSAGTGRERDVVDISDALERCILALDDFHRRWTMAETAIDYDEDFFLWTQQQATELRRLKAVGINVPMSLDLENLALEVEDMGKSDRRQAESRIERIIEHLLKLDLSPAIDPRPGWRRTVRVQRTDGLEQDGVPEDLVPRSSPYTLEQILDSNFFPGED
jgi:hypothetical protein